MQSTRSTTEPEIVGSERLDNGIVVTYRDGRTIFYSAALLETITSQAEDHTDVDRDDTGNR
jgi:hypothetical protein